MYLTQKKSTKKNIPKKNKKKIENAQINNENEDDKKKVLESNQYSEGNNTLGTVVIPKELKTGTYTLIEAKTPAEEKETIGDLLAMVIGNTLTAVFVGTILFICYIVFRLVCDFITSSF